MHFIDIKRFSLLLLISYLLPWSYTVLSRFWCDHGGASTSLNVFEFPYILLLSSSLFFSVKKTEKIWDRNVLAPGVTVLGLYVLYDLFYMYFKRSPRLSDFENFFSISHVSLFLFAGLLAYLVVLCIPVIYSIYRHLQWRSGEGKVSGGYMVIRCSIIFLILLLPFSDGFYAFQSSHMNFHGWSETRNVVKNGRIGSFIHYHNQRKAVLGKMAGMEEGKSLENYYRPENLHHRNIHIIVLESFIDPRLIEGLEFSMTPVSEELSPFLLHHSDFSLIELPVYGGGSPQSEFEILTGLPAMAKISSIEFNVFEGTETPGLVQSLKTTGYYSIVSKGSRPGFYNSTNAYRAFGFNEIHYRDKSYYNLVKGDDYLFDGDLLQANLSYVKKRLNQADQKTPLLNYVVGMFGHLPFNRNNERRPDIIEVKNGDNLMHNLTNQFFYRTQALGRFLTGLRQIDSNAVVFITSDHLPPIFQKGRKYRARNYFVNSALLLDAFQPIDISGKSLHQVSHLLWSMAGAEKGEQVMSHQYAFSKDELEGMYLSIMRKAIGL